MPHLDCTERENRDQIVSTRVFCGLAKPHLNPKTPYKSKKRRSQKIHPREIITFFVATADDPPRNVASSKYLGEV